MKILVAGGAKSGKSQIAEKIAKSLADEKKCIYIATMVPVDDEDKNRIKAHVLRRGTDFDTIECARDIKTLIRDLDKNSTVLFESVTSLMTNELYPRENGFCIDENAQECCISDLKELAHSVKNAVFVADDIFSDAIHYDENTDAFRRCLGALLCALSKECDTLIEAKFGIPIKLK